MIELVIRGIIFAFHVFYLIFLYILKFIYVIMNDPTGNYPSPYKKNSSRSTKDASRSQNSQFLTPKKRNLLDESENTYSPIRESMNSIKRSIKKLLEQVDKVEKNSPRKIKRFVDDCPDVPALGTIYMRDSGQTSTDMPSSSSSMLSNSVSQSFVPETQVQSSHKDESMNFDLDDDLEGIDSILDDFAKKAREHSFTKDELSQEKIQISEKSKKICLKLFKPNQTMANRKSILVQDSDEEFDGGRLSKNKKAVRKTFRNDSLEMLEKFPTEQIASAKNDKTISDDEKSMKTNIFKKRETLSRRDRTLVPDSDDESDNNNFAETSSQIFKKRETLSRKSRILVPGSDDEDDDNHQTEKLPQTFKKRETLSRKKCQILAGDSDDEVKNENKLQIKLHQQMMSEDSEDEVQFIKEETILKDKNLKDKPFKLKLHVPENSPTKNSLADKTDQINIDFSKGHHNREEMFKYLCNQCQNYYSSRKMTDEHLKKLANQCSRHRTFFHNPVVVPDDYFNTNFSGSPTKASPVLSQTLKVKPISRDKLFKMPIVARAVNTLGKQPTKQKSNTDRSETVSRSHKNNEYKPPEMSYDSDYEAWKADFESHTSRILNSTQFSTQN